MATGRLGSGFQGKADAFIESPPYVIDGNSQLAYIPLTREEAATFKRDFERLVYIQALERDLSSLLFDDIDYYLFAAGVAKGSIGTNPSFNGTTPGSAEIGMQLIRAVTVVNVGIGPGGTPDTLWTQTYGTPGWNNIFGSSSAPVDLSQTGTGSGATNTKNIVMLCFSALIDTVTTPLVEEYRFHVQNVDYPVEPIAWELATDIAYARLTAPVLVPVNGRFYMRGNVSAAGSDATQLFGLAFATGAYLTYET